MDSIQITTWFKRAENYWQIRCSCGAEINFIETAPAGGVAHMLDTHRKHCPSRRRAYDRTPPPPAGPNA